MNKVLNIARVAGRFNKAIGTYDQEATVQQRIAYRMLQHLRTHLKQTPQRVLEVGAGTGFYTRLLTETYAPEHFIVNDLCPTMAACYQHLKVGQLTLLMGDAEQLTFPGKQQLITSCSAIQWFNHPQAFLQKCNDSLDHDGMLALTTFGIHNFQEVRKVTGEGLDYFTLDEWSNLLSPHFEVLHLEEKEEHLHFHSPQDVLRHLKATGVTGNSERIWTRADLAHFITLYDQLYAQEGTVRLTYHSIYLLAKKRK